MNVELLYTSAGQGLKQGSRGFCTVVSTAGLPINLAQRLEALSAYRHVYQPGDPKSDRNPTCYSFVRFNVGGRLTNVLSRISAYGVDYSQRSNKLAHHLVVDHPLPSCGPAAILMRPGAMRDQWNGVCETIPTGPNISDANVPAVTCRTWERMTGDAGWGGVIAGAWMNPSNKPTWLIFSDDQSSRLLTLMSESIALLPTNKRWQATFSTYCTNLPPDVECRVRCVLQGSEEARMAKARGTVIDLTQPFGLAPINEAAEAARHGFSIGGRTTFETPVPSSQPGDDPTDLTLPTLLPTETEGLEIIEDEPLRAEPPLIKPESVGVRKGIRRNVPSQPKSFPVFLVVAVAASLLILAGLGLGLAFFFSKGRDRIAQGNDPAIKQDQDLQDDMDPVQGEIDNPRQFQKDDFEIRENKPFQINDDNQVPPDEQKRQQFVQQGGGPEAVSLPDGVGPEMRAPFAGNAFAPRPPNPLNDIPPGPAVPHGAPAIAHGGPTASDVGAAVADVGSAATDVGSTASPSSPVTSDVDLPKQPSEVSFRIVDLEGKMTDHFAAGILTPKIDKGGSEGDFSWQWQVIDDQGNPHGPMTTGNEFEVKSEHYGKRLRVKAVRKTAPQTESKQKDVELLSMGVIRVKLDDLINESLNVDKCRYHLLIQKPEIGSEKNRLEAKYGPNDILLKKEVELVGLSKLLSKTDAVNFESRVKGILSPIQEQLQNRDSLFTGLKTGAENKYPQARYLLWQLNVFKGDSLGALLNYSDEVIKMAEFVQDVRRWNDLNSKNNRNSEEKEQFKSLERALIQTVNGYPEKAKTLLPDSQEARTADLKRFAEFMNANSVFWERCVSSSRNVRSAIQSLVSTELSYDLVGQVKLYGNEEVEVGSKKKPIMSFPVRAYFEFELSDSPNVKEFKKPERPSKPLPASPNQESSRVSESSPPGPLN